MREEIKKKLLKLIPKTNKDLVYYRSSDRFNSSQDESFYVVYKEKEVQHVAICCHDCGELTLAPADTVESMQPSSGEVGKYIHMALKCPKCGGQINTCKGDYWRSSFGTWKVKETYIECIPENGIFNIITAAFDFWGNAVDISYKELQATDLYELITFRNTYNSENRTFVFPRTRFTVFNEMARLFPYSGISEFKSFLRNENQHSFYTDSDTELYYCYYAKYPFIEQLVKAGYCGPVKTLIRCNGATTEQKFSRCFKPGTSIKDIIQMPEAYAKILKTESLDRFDEWRIFVKKYNPSLESFKSLIENNFTTPEIKMLKQIISYGFYDLDTLMNYIDRCNMFQAIPPAESLILIRDYNKMAKDMGTEPDTNSNSLKREHDVMARNYVVNVSEEQKRKFERRVEFFKTLEYENDRFVIVAPNSPADIIEEGKMQANCVGSYVSSICQGRETILFLRRKSNPLKSYITISIDPDSFTIKQAYERANRPISDPDVKDFMFSWTQHLIAKFSGEQKQITSSAVAC